MQSTTEAKSDERNTLQTQESAVGSAHQHLCIRQPQAAAVFPAGTHAISLISYAHGQVASVEALLRVVPDDGTEVGNLALAILTLLTPARAALYGAAQALQEDGSSGQAAYSTQS